MPTRATDGQHENPPWSRDNDEPRCCLLAHEAHPRVLRKRGRPAPRLFVLGLSQSMEEQCGHFFGFLVVLGNHRPRHRLHRSCLMTFIPSLSSVLNFPHAGYFVNSIKTKKYRLEPQHFRRNPDYFFTLSAMIRREFTSSRSRFAPGFFPRLFRRLVYASRTASQPTSRT